VKITANAGALADALALAARLDSTTRKRPEALEAITLTAGDGTLTVAGNVLDHALSLRVPADISGPGALAVSGPKLAALTAAFAPDATIEIASDGAIARVSCGRSRFKLPITPADILPPPLALTGEIGRVELAAEEAALLFERPTFAMSSEDTRYYLRGILLHDCDDGLAAVATDGHRLCRVVVPGAGGLSDDRSLIIPAPAIKIIHRIIAAKDVERVALARSRTLVGVETASASFVSKLVDGTFPDYARIIPKPSGNAVTVERATLAQVVERAAAAADLHQRQVVGLSWSADEPVLRIQFTDSDAAYDVIDAEVAGNCGAAVQIKHIIDLLDALDGERIRLDSRGLDDRGSVAPILITDPADADLTMVQMPCEWHRSAQAA
jgi:DNA polymerase-3 subunit beta